MIFKQGDDGLIRPDQSSKNKKQKPNLFALFIAGALLLAGNMFVANSVAASPLEVFLLQTIGAVNLMFVAYYLNSICQSGD